MPNIATNIVFLLFWSLIYIILGFETTVVMILLFILASVRKKNEN